MARVSGAQRDFLLAGLWKEQEIPRWRCERKAVFPEEIAGAEARAEWHHRAWRRVGMSTWQGGRQLPAPEEDGPGRLMSGGCLLQEVAELGTF